MQDSAYPATRYSNKILEYLSHNLVWHMSRHHLVPAMENHPDKRPIHWSPDRLLYLSGDCKTLHKSLLPLFHITQNYLLQTFRRRMYFPILKEFLPALLPTHRPVPSRLTQPVSQNQIHPWLHSFFLRQSKNPNQNKCCPQNYFHIQKR